jgi:hypothetical protein
LPLHNRGRNVIASLGVVTADALTASARQLATHHHSPALAWGNDPTQRCYLAAAACPHGACVTTALRAEDYEDLYYDNAEQLITLWYERQRRGWLEGCCATTEEATPNG